MKMLSNRVKTIGALALMAAIVCLVSPKQASARQYDHYVTVDMPRSAYVYMYELFGVKNADLGWPRVNVTGPRIIRFPYTGNHLVRIKGNRPGTTAVRITAKFNGRIYSRDVHVTVVR